MSQYGKGISNSGPGAYIQTLTGNSGGAVGPLAGNIDVVGTGVITVVGNPGTHTLTITPSGSIASSFITTPATGTATPAAGILTFSGTGGIVVSAAGSTVTVDGSGISGAGTITGNTGGPQAQTANNWDIVTDNSTVEFTGASSALTLDFGLSNLFLGAKPPIAGAFENVGIGFNAGFSVTDSVANVFIGYNAGGNIIDGGQCVAIGDGALARAAISCADNVAIGYDAMSDLGDAASGNTAVGSQSMNSLDIGSNNLALGSSAGSAWNSSESSNIAIQSPGNAGDNGVTRIGTNGIHSTCFIAGIDGVDVGSIATVVTESGDQLGTAVITAGSGISVTPGANTITIAATATAFSWSVITADQTAAVNNGYLCNKAGTLALALPATSAVGDIIEVTNENTALGVQFTQAAGQQILIGNTNTTFGATGTLTSSAVGDTLKIVCKVANTIWRVTSGWGNWTPA